MNAPVDPSFTCIMPRNTSFASRNSLSSKMSNFSFLSVHLLQIRLLVYLLLNERVQLPSASSLRNGVAMVCAAWNRINI